MTGMTDQRVFKSISMAIAPFVLLEMLLREEAKLCLKGLFADS